MIETCTVMKQCFCHFEKNNMYTIANKNENHQQFGLGYKDWCREKLTKHSFTTLLWLVSVFFCISLYNFFSSEALHNCILRPDLDGKSVVYYYNYLQGMIRVLYMSFDKFLFAVKSRDLSQADKSIKRVSSFPKAVFKWWNLQLYQKKTIWNLAIWQNWCFGQFYHLKNCKIEK